MAQKRQRRRSKKWVARVVVLLMLVLAGVICFLVWDAYFRPSETREKNDSQTVTTEGLPQTTSSQAQAEEIVDASGEIVDTTTERQDEYELTEVVQYEGENPNQSEELTGAITYAGINGDRLTIRVNLDQYLTGGQCVLTLQRGGTKIHEERAQVASVASTATCAGFDIPLEGLGHGATEILINVDSGEKNGVMQGEVTL